MRIRHIIGVQVGKVCPKLLGNNILYYIIGLEQGHSWTCSYVADILEYQSVLPVNIVTKHTSLFYERSCILLGWFGWFRVKICQTLTQPNLIGFLKIEPFKLQF